MVWRSAHPEEPTRFTANRAPRPAAAPPEPSFSTADAWAVTVIAVTVLCSGMPLLQPILRHPIRLTRFSEAADHELWWHFGVVGTDGDGKAVLCGETQL